MSKFKQGKEESNLLKQANWNQEWKDDSWNYLAKAPAELSRLAVIGAILIPTYVPVEEASILDIGCGEGMLLEYLNSTYTSGYVGLDISKEAIGKAEARRPDSRFIISSVTDYLLERSFYDIIVLSEVLNQVDYESILITYEFFMPPKGIMIISLSILKGSCDEGSQKQTEAIISFTRKRFHVIKELELVDLSNHFPDQRDNRKDCVLVLRRK